MEALGEASSHGLKKQVVALSGERSYCLQRSRRATIAGLLIAVLTGLGGASQEDLAALIFGFRVDLRGAVELIPSCLFFNSRSLKIRFSLVAWSD